MVWAMYSMLQALLEVCYAYPKERHILLLSTWACCYLIYIYYFIAHTNFTVLMMVFILIIYSASLYLYTKCEEMSAETKRWGCCLCRCVLLKSSLWTHMLLGKRFFCSLVALCNNYLPLNFMNWSREHFSLCLSFTTNPTGIVDHSSTMHIYIRRDICALNAWILFSLSKGALVGVPRPRRGNLRHNMNDS